MKSVLPTPEVDLRVRLEAAVIKLAEFGVARKSATPAPSPSTPVKIGSPVALVSVTADGVPRLGVTKFGEFAKTTVPVPFSSLSKAANSAEEVKEGPPVIPSVLVATHSVPAPVV